MIRLVLYPMTAASGSCIAAHGQSHLESATEHASAQPPAAPNGALPVSDPINRRAVLVKRPDGLPADDCFEIRDERLGVLGEGRVRVAVEAISIDPAMRAWLDAENYMAPIRLGDTMRGLAVGRVVESRVDKFAAGDHVQGPLGVQRMADMHPAMLRRIEPDGLPASAWIGALGLTGGLTAYFGLIDLGRPQAGDLVLMSAAAGAVGSIAGQIARIKGARVVGIAGGAAKCAYVTDELGFDACIDYKNEDVHAAIGRLAPEGVDVFFDNVGGEILDAALDHLAQRARVVLCGAISQYNHKHDVRGPRNYLRIAERNACMAGFTVDRFAPGFADAEAELAGWLRSGELVVREHFEHGVERFPATLRMLFDGSHTGKLLLAP